MTCLVQNARRHKLRSGIPHTVAVRGAFSVHVCHYFSLSGIHGSMKYSPFSYSTLKWIRALKIQIYAFNCWNNLKETAIAHDYSVIADWYFFK